MERQLAADLCLPILAIRPRKDSGLAPSVVAAAVKSGGGDEKADQAGDASPPAGNSPQAMERACTLLVDMVARDGTLEVSDLADDKGPRTRLGECLLDLACDQARILAARLQRSGTSSADVGDDLARPHEGPFLLLRELLRTVEPAGPQVRTAHLARSLTFHHQACKEFLSVWWCLLRSCGLGTTCWSRCSLCCGPMTTRCGAWCSTSCYRPSSRVHKTPPPSTLKY